MSGEILRNDKKDYDSFDEEFDVEAVRVVVEELNKVFRYEFLGYISNKDDLKKYEKMGFEIKYREPGHYLIKEHNNLSVVIPWVECAAR